MFMRLPSLLAITLILFSTAGPAGAATFRVPSEYADIAAAFVAAGEGDTVLVEPGTYTGIGNRAIDFGGINRVVLSETGAETTIIDCEEAASGFFLISGEDSTSVINGFTITNADGGNGGAIDINHAAATIEDCIFANNHSSNGGAIYCGYNSSRSYIRGCIFYGNTASFRGGGINCDHGNTPYFPPFISNCVFFDNTAGIDDVYGGGAIYSNYSPALITACTIVGNAGDPGEAGGLHSHSAPMTAINCIIAHNTGSGGANNINVERCLMYNNEGTDLIYPEEPEIIELDPLFCDLVGRVLTLCNDSCCLPGAVNNPWGVQLGALAAGCANCGMGTEESSWGSIKSMLRN